MGRLMQVMKIPTAPESVVVVVRRHMTDAELWEKTRCGCPVCTQFRYQLKKAKDYVQAGGDVEAIKTKYKLTALLALYCAVLI